MTNTTRNWVNLAQLRLASGSAVFVVILDGHYLTWIDAVLRRDTIGRVTARRNNLRITADDKLVEVDGEGSTRGDSDAAGRSDALVTDRGMGNAAPQRRSDQTAGR